MTMKIQFNPKQEYQLAAVDAVVDIFEGQPIEKDDFSVIYKKEASGPGYLLGLEQTELGVANNLLLKEPQIKNNVRNIQLKNDIEITNPVADLESWPILGQKNEFLRYCYHFSIEMETGTGKTYVYLRTIFELSRRYGFKKFIIVVPSVAIREGVLKNIEITRDHFQALYNNVEFESFVYDAKKINRLRQFATSNSIQILVINIDAFRKNFTGTESEQKSNVIYKESDKLSGRQPIEFIQATNPVVIIDEPQSVDSTDKSQEAIKALNPLCTLRYSATHKNPYNLVYRLDPIRAFELRLVKQIIVASVTGSNEGNAAFVKVEKIDNTKGIKAKVKLHEQTPQGPKEKSRTVKLNTDLFEISNNRACYRDGFLITEINAEPGNEFVKFNNGNVLRLGQELGGLSDDIWRVQIRNTIKKHLEKELQVKEHGLKVLSLFFIDRVANYRGYDESGQPVKGKFAIEFEKALAELSKDPQFKDLQCFKEPVERIHNGYFATDKKGILKDTGGNTQADDDVYSLIMKEKERLLSIDEPLRFIFSHSALREGWDNPNVFQICTLNETQSGTKKRQEIGRGLRLPVNQDGHRVHDESINKLYIVANENYEEFARLLQNEYEEDCGVTFGKVPVTAFARMAYVVDGKEQPLGREASAKIHKELIDKGFLDTSSKIQPAFDPRKPDFSLNLSPEFKPFEKCITDVLSSYQIERHIRKERDEGKNRLRKNVQLSPEFKELWDRIKQRTTYRVEYKTPDLVVNAVQAIKRMQNIQPSKIGYTAGALALQKSGVTTTGISSFQENLDYHGPLPDILAYLQSETELTRSTLVQILKESGRLSEFFINPQAFMDSVACLIKNELHRLLIDGIKYDRIPSSEPEAEWEMLLFKDEEVINYLSALQVNRSVYEYIVYDSEIEREFAAKLDKRDDIKLFVKLPGWFKIETPIGSYNPDWAIVKHNDQTLYLVRETKDTKDFLKLRNSEADKIRCGQKHFEALEVPFAVVVTADEV